MWDDSGGGGVQNCRNQDLVKPQSPVWVSPGSAPVGRDELKWNRKEMERAMTALHFISVICHNPEEPSVADRAAVVQPVENIGFHHGGRWRPLSLVPLMLAARSVLPKTPHAKLKNENQLAHNGSFPKTPLPAGKQLLEPARSNGKPSLVESSTRPRKALLDKTPGAHLQNRGGGIKLNVQPGNGKQL
ncbi:6121_t:CDS:2, partial [Acaulospora colombiana]